MKSQHDMFRCSAPTVLSALSSPTRVTCAPTSCASASEYRLTSAAPRGRAFTSARRRKGERRSPHSVSTRSLPTAAAPTGSSNSRAASDGVSSSRMAPTRSSARPCAAPSRATPSGTSATGEPESSEQAASHTPKTLHAVTSVDDGCARDARHACDARLPPWPTAMHRGVPVVVPEVNDACAKGVRGTTRGGAPLPSSHPRRTSSGVPVCGHNKTRGTTSPPASSPSRLEASSGVDTRSTGRTASNVARNTLRGWPSSSGQNASCAKRTAKYATMRAGVESNSTATHGTAPSSAPGGTLADARSTTASACDAATSSANENTTAARPGARKCSTAGESGLVAATEHSRPWMVSLKQVAPAIRASTLKSVVLACQHRYYAQVEMKEATASDCVKSLFSSLVRQYRVSPSKFVDGTFLSFFPEFFFSSVSPYHHMVFDSKPCCSFDCIQKRQDIIAPLSGHALVI